MYNTVYDITADKPRATSVWRVNVKLLRPLQKVAYKKKVYGKDL